MTGTGFMYALLAGVGPSLVWLFFWTREDRDQPEPRSLLMGCFLAGMCAVFLAIPAEKYVAALLGGGPSMYALWAAIEEILKFVAVAAVALHSRYYDEPVDAMIYCIAVALGFAALENSLFIMGPLISGSLSVSLTTGNMRFIGATLVHVVSSGLVGFFLGTTFYRGRFARFLAWAVGLAGAIAIHSAFNIAIVGAGVMDTLKAFGWIWGAVVIMIVLFEEVKAVKPRLANPAAGEV
jgi:RsiW-degrading membrane proteinase PrsW (M82 family)